MIQGVLTRLFCDQACRTYLLPFQVERVGNIFQHETRWLANGDWFPLCRAPDGAHHRSVACTHGSNLQGKGDPGDCVGTRTLAHVGAGKGKCVRSQKITKTQ